jgi:hypothetical protein
MAVRPGIRGMRSRRQEHLIGSRNLIIDYYLPRVIKSPPNALLGRILQDAPTENEARRWLSAELDRVFPNAKDLVQDMLLEVQYKDVTFETLNRPDFLDTLKVAVGIVDWEKTYNEFKAAGEVQAKE